MMTRERKQELFNIAWRGLKSQGFQQSVLRNEDGTPKMYTSWTGEETAICAYRDPQGRKCAVGWMIPDEKYSPDLENRLASYETVRVAAGLVASNDWDEEPQFARQLQHVHDSKSSNTPEKMEARLRLFAATRDLDIPQDA